MRHLLRRYWLHTVIGVVIALVATVGGLVAATEGVAIATPPPPPPDSPPGDLPTPPVNLEELNGDSPFFRDGERVPIDELIEKGYAIRTKGLSTKGWTIEIGDKLIKLPEDTYISNRALGVYGCNEGQTYCPQPPIYELTRGNSVIRIDRTGHVLKVEVVPGEEGVFDFLDDVITGEVQAEEPSEPPGEDIAVLRQTAVTAKGLAEDFLPEAVLRQLDVGIREGGMSFRFTDPEAKDTTIHVSVPGLDAPPEDWRVVDEGGTQLIGWPKPGMNLDALRVGPEEASSMAVERWSDCHVESINLGGEGDNLYWRGTCDATGGFVDFSVNGVTGEFKRVSVYDGPVNTPVTATPVTR